MQRRVLVIEDNHDIARLIHLHLTELGCTVTVLHNGAAGMETACRDTFDLIVLDLMLPEQDGLEICRVVRAQNRYTPILMLTARTSELDRVLGLELGADDYLTKPFSLMEFRARVKAIFRRTEAMLHQRFANDEVIDVNGFRIDLAKRTARHGDTTLDLTTKEFDLLAFFARHPGRVYSRAQLLDEVWGHGFEGYEHTVNSHINRLRAKIEADPAKPVFILTVWGIGYKFAEAPATTTSR